MRYMTAGESHGKGLSVIIEGIPSGLIIDFDEVQREMTRRQGGYGRGRRMQIEQDAVDVRGGIRHGYTTGAPISLFIENKDHTHWTQVMQAEPLQEELERPRTLTRPRPGHADLVGGLKYGHRDLRDVLERSSARETAARVAVGAIAKQLLRQLEIDLFSHVRSIGGVDADVINPLTYRDAIETSPVRCADEEAAERMMAAIDQAKKDGDTLGGEVEVVVTGVMPGIGSFTQNETKLDSRIARAVISVNAMKAVGFGDGFELARRKGSTVQDEILHDETGYFRKTNHLGGIEGGMSTGMPIRVQVAMKPIPTLYRPLQSVDIETKEPFVAQIERSDACAVPAAAVVLEAVVAVEIAAAVLEMFGTSTLDRLKQAVTDYREEVRLF
ncbi:chorismate synthase [Exiguobacterium sp. RIT594]|uniref:chorismate synthase n=1 Tax=Exiguobacterium sp. RIT594 TaxID=2282449 RepID=UPI000DF7DA38|nr:chorismate synthase [Exiguobacterium sp. RIT594]RDB33864.1 chorismate synthase [Exiguobacterium sp. RIT594]